MTRALRPAGTDAAFERPSFRATVAGRGPLASARALIRRVRLAFGRRAADGAAALRQADRLRDGGRAAEAARAYGRILARAPHRHDIGVQFGNMLKDAGRPQDAVDAYRRVLAARPDDADALLQLGHALKALGRREAAIEAYRGASRLGAALDADRELAALGEAAEQERLSAAQPGAEALRRIVALGDAIDDMRGRLDRMSGALPALGALLAVPIEGYGRYRAAFSIPPPPSPAARRVTVLCLADEVSPATLARQIGSVRGQNHGDWRLLVLGRDAVRRALVERHGREDGRIAWEAIADAPAAAELRVALRQDGPVLLLAPGARLDPNALGWFASAFDLAGCEAFVCDEEEIEEADGRTIHRGPVLRQAVDHDTLLERNAFGETVAVTAACLRARATRLRTASIAASRSSLLLDLARDAAVGHVPFPLVHRAAGAAGPPDPAAHADAVAAHRARLGAGRGPSCPPGIALVIPSRDNAQDVEALVASLRATAEDGRALDILVLDDGGTDPRTRAVLDGLAARGAARTVRVDEPFNWSRLNNCGAAATDAPLLVFANDDMRMLTPGWDARLRELLARPGVGAVGAKLLYPDGTVQHAGIVSGWRPSPTHHDGLHRTADDPGPAGRWAVTRAAAAVTGAFLATPRDAFAAVGGFDEASLGVGYGDIDYALRLRAAGLRVLWTPHVVLQHHESKSRGLDHLDPARAARAEAEAGTMLRRWPGALSADPGVHPAWRPETLPFRLLDPWSAERAAVHVRLTGGGRPWAVSGPVPAAGGSAPG